MEAMLDVAFDLVLAHGRCVGVRLPTSEEEVRELAASLLEPEEQAFAVGLPPARRRTWVGGRAAVRRALEAASLDARGCILPDDRGAPRFPAGVAGSISHKETLAVALVTAKQGTIGVDVELDRVGRQDISRHVLAEDEIGEIAGLEGDVRAREVLLRFSTKEAIYKALDPFVRRYVAFHEVSVTPRPDGTADVRARLRPGEGPFAVEVTWRRAEGVILTTSRVTTSP
jgi:4'-phosphopantetheinyl transferase EntD